MSGLILFSDEKDWDYCWKFQGEISRINLRRKHSSLVLSLGGELNTPEKLKSFFDLMQKPKFFGLITSKYQRVIKKDFNLSEKFPGIDIAYSSNYRGEKRTSDISFSVGSEEEIINSLKLDKDLSDEYRNSSQVSSLIGLINSTIEESSANKKELISLRNFLKILVLNKVGYSYYF